MARTIANLIVVLIGSLITTTHRDAQFVATASSSRTFVQLSNNKPRVEFLPKAGLRLYNVSTQDLGTYTVNINLFHGWNVINKQRSVTLALPDTPVLSSGRLRAWVVSGTVTLRGSSHVRLACGTINNHQHANFSVTWTTPSGRSLPSTSQADGVFYLTLDNPVVDGPYSCQLLGITALSCLGNGSQTTMAVVDVDALGARMLVLEDSARRHDRVIEHQERVADVVSQSINNITVTLQVVDELTKETSERVDNLCTHVQVINNVTTQTAQRMDNLSTHVQVIDNVTTQTAQRMDKVTRNVEDQREAQSRMKESLNGVMEELTNQSAHVTNLALSVDDLKSDTAKLSGSVDTFTTDTKTLSGSVDSLTSDTKTLNRSLDSLTSDTKTLKRSFDSLTTDTKTLTRSLDSLMSDTKTLTRSLDSLTTELRTTVDVQRKQIGAMASQGEKQHADMVLLLQKTNNLTALAERQQEELIQQKQTISKLSTIIDTQNGKMAQQRKTITTLMSNLTSVVDVLGTMTRDMANKRVAFHVRIPNSLSDNLQLNHGERLVLTKVVYNQGHGYSSSTGVFTAPHSGTYTFLATMVPYGSSAYADVYIKVDGTEVNRCLSYLAGISHACDAVVHLTAGQRVWMECNGEGYFYYGGTAFSGFLVSLDP